MRINELYKTNFLQNGYQTITRTIYQRNSNFLSVDTILIHGTPAGKIKRYFKDSELYKSLIYVLSKDGKKIQKSIINHLV